MISPRFQWSPAVIAALLATLLLAGCQLKALQELPLTKFKAESMLDRGIHAYDDGEYKLAARTIQDALDAGLTKRSQGRAHKYLAFIHCTAGRQAQCRSEFRKGLEVDPRLELSASEDGHPLWAPVFRSVKASIAKS